MKKVFLFIIFSIIQHQIFSQVMDFSATYKTALELYSKGNYGGAKVRFVIAQRKALQEQNYQGKELCLSYAHKCDDCIELTTKGDQYFDLGDFEGAKKYYDGIYELNPKDPKNMERAQKCRNETDFITSKKQADVFYNAGDWWQAGTLYEECLDSSKHTLSSYKRFESEMIKRNQECIRRKNMSNPDSLKMKAKMLTEKWKKKVKPDEKKPEESKPEDKKKIEPGKVMLRPSFNGNLDLRNYNCFIFINRRTEKNSQIMNCGIA